MGAYVKKPLFVGFVELFNTFYCFSVNIKIKNL